MKTIHLNLFLILLSTIFIACSKDEDDNKVSNTVDLYKLEGKSLLIAKQWTCYKIERDGIALPNLPESFYNFNADNTYSYYSEAGTENGKWRVDNDSLIRSLYIDDDRWQVNIFNPDYMKISFNHHILGEETRHLE
jgi:hypothetical protein